MPFYNAERTLGEAIDSIRLQTASDWELLLCDDGSSDRSSSIAKERAAGDKRIGVISQEHSGIVPALHTLCAIAEGCYIARMDADDIADPTRLEKQLDFMERNPDTGLCGCHVRPFGHLMGDGTYRYCDWLNSLGDYEAIRREIFIECPIAHPTFFIRNDRFQSIGGYETCPWPEDYDLLLRFWRAGIRLDVVPEQLLAWRYSPDRLSFNDERYSATAFRALKREYLESQILKRCSKESPPRPFFQWGAGETGKRWLLEWRNFRPVAVVDVDPRKLGGLIHGVPVIPPDDLPPAGRSCILIAVGAPGARDRIRPWLNARGHIEGADYWFIA